MAPHGWQRKGHGSKYRPIFGAPPLDMPYQGLVIEGIRDAEVIVILRFRTCDNVVKVEEAKLKYDKHQGVLSKAFADVLNDRVGRLMKHILPLIIFWRHAYNYLKYHNLHNLTDYYCCGRASVKVWTKVIEVYYLKHYGFNREWNSERFRNHKKICYLLPMVDHDWEQPVIQ